MVTQSYTLWEFIMCLALGKLPSVCVVAVSPTARVAVEWTAAGVKIGPHLFQCRGLPGGVSPPHSDSLNEEVVEHMLCDERPVLARQVTIQGRSSIPGACEWWFRRPNSALPLALMFVETTDEMALPGRRFCNGHFRLDRQRCGGQTDHPRCQEELGCSYRPAKSCRGLWLRCLASHHEP